MKVPSETASNNFTPTIARGNFRPHGRDFPRGVGSGRFSNGRLILDFPISVGHKPSRLAYLEPMYNNISDFASGVCFALKLFNFDLFVFAT